MVVTGKRLGRGCFKMGRPGDLPLGGFMPNESLEKTRGKQMTRRGPEAGWGLQAQQVATWPSGQ